MRLIKRILYIILAVVIVTLSIIYIILKVDDGRTDYLELSNNPDLQKNSYLIVNAHIVPMDRDTVLKNKMILVTEGRIEKIADSISKNSLHEIQILDAQNNYISPGLIDMHVHLWDKYELGLYLANGVTTIRNLWGMPMHLRWQNDLNEEVLISPAFFTTSPKLTGPQDLGDDKVQLSDPADAREKVNDYVSRGYSFIKTYAGLPKEYFDAVLEEAGKINIDVVSHPSFELPYEYHFNPQIASLEHAEDIVQQALNYQLDTLKLDEVVNNMAKHSQSFSPTLTGYYKIFEMLNTEDLSGIDHIDLMNPLIRKVDSKAQFERWAGEKSSNPEIKQRIWDQHSFHLMILKKLHKAGVNIICSTDAGIGITVPGFSIHEELGFYREAGFTNYEALKTATYNPSKTHVVLRDFGSITEGKWANFMVTSTNPLEDLNALKSLKWVMVKGRKLSDTKLNSFVEKAKNRKNLTVSMMNYGEYLWVER